MLKLNTLKVGIFREGDIEPGDFNTQIAIFLRF
jgi:hypothetical protein